MTLTSAIDLSNLSGFTETYFKVLDRFRNVAVDNHTGSGGNLSEIDAHVRGVVEPQDMMQQFDPPLLMTVPTPVDSDYSTTTSETGTVAFQLISWVWDKNEQYALEESALYAAKTVDNVEGDRSLLDGNSKTPVHDVRFVNFAPDFRVTGGEGPLYLKYTEVDFEVEYKRKT